MQLQTCLTFFSFVVWSLHSFARATESCLCLRLFDDFLSFISNVWQCRRWADTFLQLPSKLIWIFLCLRTTDNSLFALTTKHGNDESVEDKVFICWQHFQKNSNHLLRPKSFTWHLLMPNYAQVVFHVAAVCIWFNFLMENFIFAFFKWKKREKEEKTEEYFNEYVSESTINHPITTAFYLVFCSSIVALFLFFQSTLWICSSKTTMFRIFSRTYNLYVRSYSLFYAPFSNN